MRKMDLSLALRTIHTLLYIVYDTSGTTAVVHVETHRSMTQLNHDISWSRIIVYCRLTS